METKIIVGDEESYYSYADDIIQNLCRITARKNNMQLVSCLDACMKLEDMAHQEALKDASCESNSEVWRNSAAIEVYEQICTQIVRTLEDSERKDWAVKYQENPPMALFRLLSGRTTIAIGNPIPGKRGRPRGEDGGGYRDRRHSKGKKRKPQKKAGGGYSIPKANV
jgi:hypothetical protein